MKEMRQRFVAYLARLDDRMRAFTAEEATAVANNQKEIDWPEARFPDAENFEPEPLDDSPEEKIFVEMKKGLVIRDLTFDKAMFFRNEHHLKVLAQKYKVAHEIKQKEVDWLEEHVALLNARGDCSDERHCHHKTCIERRSNA
jgi:pullulanase/glycogen debranching enzyme